MDTVAMLMQHGCGMCRAELDPLTTFVAAATAKQADGSEQMGSLFLCPRCAHRVAAMRMKQEHERAEAAKAAKAAVSVGEAEETTVIREGCDEAGSDVSQV